jgi:hypothetical protein
VQQRHPGWGSVRNVESHIDRAQHSQRSARACETRGTHGDGSWSVLSPPPPPLYFFLFSLLDPVATLRESSSRGSTCAPGRCGELRGPPVSFPRSLAGVVTATSPPQGAPDRVPGGLLQLATMTSKEGAAAASGPQRAPRRVRWQPRRAPRAAATSRSELEGAVHQRFFSFFPKLFLQSFYHHFIVFKVFSPKGLLHKLFLRDFVRNFLSSSKRFSISFLCLTFYFNLSQKIPSKVFPKLFS